MKRHTTFLPLLLLSGMAAAEGFDCGPQYRIDADISKSYWRERMSPAQLKNELNDLDQKIKNAWSTAPVDEQTKTKYIELRSTAALSRCISNHLSRNDQIWRYENFILPSDAATIGKSNGMFEQHFVSEDGYLVVRKSRPILKYVTRRFYGRG